MRATLDDFLPLLLSVIGRKRPVTVLAQVDAFPLVRLSFVVEAHLLSLSAALLRGVYRLMRIRRAAVAPAAEPVRNQNYQAN